MKLDVLDLTGKKVGDVELNDSVFACEVNNQAIFDALLRQQSSWRQGTHDTKTRAEVSGGGRSLSDRRAQVEQDRVRPELHSTDMVLSPLARHLDLIPSSSTEKSEDWHSEAVLH